MNTFMTAVLNTVIGMGTVFVVLILISLLISLFRFIPLLEEMGRKRAQEKEKKNAAKAVLPEREETSAAKEPEEEPVDTDVLIAVIAAAIAASEGGAVSADRLVVRSVRRVGARKALIDF